MRLEHLLYEISHPYRNWQLISSITPQTLPRYGGALNAFFEQLVRLDEMDSGVMMQMVQGHHPLKKMAEQLISLGRKAGEQKVREDNTIACRRISLYTFKTSRGGLIDAHRINLCQQPNPSGSPACGNSFSRPH